MTSDDVTSWVAISFGTTASIAATLLLLDFGSTPTAALDLAAYQPAPSADALIPRSRLLVDYAIIRSDVETMVGPEGPHSGWLPQDPSEFRRR